MDPPGPPTQAEDPERPAISSIQPSPTSHTKRNIAIILTAVIALGAVATAYELQSSLTSNNPPWLFKGAYATYAEQTTVANVPFNITVRLLVIDFNSTDVEETNYYSVQSPLVSNTNQTTSWEKTNTAANFTSVPGLTYENAFSTTRVVNGKTYDCTAIRFALYNVTFVYYVENKVRFPVEITFSEPVNKALTLNFDLLLVRSNIPGLS